MPRKTAGSLEEARRDIKRRYKRQHGTRAEDRIVNVDSMTETERAVKKEGACFLKAADFSYKYIGCALGISPSAVRKWFDEDEKMRLRVVAIQKDYVDGGILLLKTYAIELVEMLVEIARSDIDPKTRITAITEALDRMGMSKVNKSDSKVTKTEHHEVDLTDKSGLVEAMKDAPPEVQQKMAQKLEELQALASEHTGKDVMTNA